LGISSLRDWHLIVYSRRLGRNPQTVPPEQRTDRTEGKFFGQIEQAAHFLAICLPLDAPTRTGLEGVDRPEVRDAVVGTEGLYCAGLQDGFSRGGKISPLHENAGWAGVLECG
jgi:hypothetical protein